MIFLPLPERFRIFHRNSPMREGVFCWYPFEPGLRVLDESHGILTQLLQRKSLIIVDDAPVDYVVSLDSDDFSVDTLKAWYDKIQPNGRLLLAYENPFALRYWAGTRATNTGRPYDTLFGRGTSPLPSKVELQKRLDQTGYKKCKWYYLLNDHWFTGEVYSDEYLPNEHLNQRFIPYILEDKYLCFDEVELYREVIRGGAFPFMCGAYVVEACMSENLESCGINYATMTSYREPSGRFVTTIWNDGIVRKTPLCHEGIASIRQVHLNHEDLRALGVPVIQTRLEKDTLMMPFLNLPTLGDYLARKLSNNELDEAEMFSLFDRLKNNIYKAFAKGRCYWEMIPANCFYDKEKDELIFFDQEYYWDDVGPEIAMARVLIFLHYSVVFRNNPRTVKWWEILKDRYNLSKNWETLSSLANDKIIDMLFFREERKLRNTTEKVRQRIEDMRCETSKDIAKETTRYKNFQNIIEKIRKMGITRPLIYGFGVRGKTLRDVFESSDINDIIFIDEKLEKYSSIENVPKDIFFDCIIVSILGGSETAEHLREKINVPVYLLEDLCAN